MYNPYTTPHELLYMKNSFKQMIMSKASNNVEVSYKEPIRVTSDGPYDDTAEQWVTIKKHMRAIVKIVQPPDEDILRWGILVTGDALFWFLPNSIELEESKYNTLELKCNENIWTPIAHQEEEKDFHHYISMLIGNEQIAQVLAGRLKR